MGHLVEQVEVDAIESQVSKAPSNTSQTPPVLHTASQQPSQHQPAQQQAQQQAKQQQGDVGLSGRKGQGRSASGQQGITRTPDSQKDPENGSPDKKPREDTGSGEEAGEEDEGGWWTERAVMGALGGVGKYRDAWYRGHTHLLHGDGPLPHSWRLYIAAMAVCRHEVGWLVQALLADFRAAGGEARWVSGGLQHAPPKMSALAPLNAILAHQPWLLSAHHIQQLTKGEDSWSLGELCQALCIMTHFHALATFLHGAGMAARPRTTIDKEVSNSNSGVSNKTPARPPLDSPDTTTPAAPPCKRTSSSDTVKSSVASKSRCQARMYPQLTVNPTFTYEDFNGADDSRVPCLSVQDYNWQDHGYAMCSRLVGSEVGALLDDRFTRALALPQVPSVKSQAGVDQQNNPVTQHPVKALWHYVQWLLGIHRDDCDYQALNQHLEPQLKAFLKAACCYPETLPSPDSKTPNDQVEACVVAMEARLQSEMLYALRAITLHQC